MGGYLKNRLLESQNRHEAIGDVRGAGLLVGVEIVSDRETKEPGHEFIKVLSERCYELGLDVNRVGGPHAVWRLAPPLTIKKEEIDQGRRFVVGPFVRTRSSNKILLGVAG